ncbi:PREDICTED: phospholipase D3-like isoform X2 [Priapulus caudatus]|uniref:Phospholipase D3-like isoform X2 n=1 Tax=Priapulus caudatus TaxID=37621 RepID=A0ABM1EDJ8_PRICU|nr:PREDICTED: phospholipase D3-like isoform X2 [Priapulus caudatus]
MTFDSRHRSHVSVFEGWMTLLDLAEESIDIASSYWTLRGSDVPQVKDPSSWQGEKIFEKLVRAGKERGIKIRIAQDQPSEYQPDIDTQELHDMGVAQVRSLNFNKLIGAGILHTKMWLVDNKHFYIGSGNLDWRSLTQVKELGAVVYNCTCLAQDLAKIFEVYWYLGRPTAQIPDRWPVEFETAYNLTMPLTLSFNETTSTTFLASSPPQLCPTGRSTDIDAIIHIIQSAKRFIYIAVMDYFPTYLYTYPRRFWPVIDNELRRATLEKGVDVRLMASWWNHSRPDLPKYLLSLQVLTGALRANVETKLFEVPSTDAQRKIPYARVNHNKYMVTDNAAYIGTSNWSGDYFVSTGGIGFIVNQTDSSWNTTSPNGQPIREQLQAIFERDWTSAYAHPIDKYLPALSVRS